jgi:isopentenyl diphosphate isomerase/L-lactate dehydrogenase-like FMN-dependent dehydrogenase
MSDHKLSRRQALGSVGAIVAGTVAGSKLAAGQTPAAPGAPRPIADASAPRLAPRDELVNVLEYEEEAKKKLAPATFALIAGGDRAMFDRITLRPRMLVPTLDMDLTQTILGDAHFVPILVGPVSEQKRFHPDGEIATAKGSSAAKAFMIVSSHSSVPVDQIAAQNKNFWYQVYAADGAAKTQIADGVKAGAKAIVITVGAAPGSGAKPATAASINWGAVDSLKQGVSVPVLVKGITTPAEATAALQHGAQGIIVSNFGGLLASKDAPILDLPKIVDAVAGKAPVLVDGSFRRGTDVLKALALGAQGVILARPAIWGLAAYGDAGVQGVVEMLQTELARYMGMCGKSTIKMLDRTVVKVHGPLPAKTSTAPATTNN